MHLEAGFVGGGGGKGRTIPSMCGEAMPSMGAATEKSHSSFCELKNLDDDDNRRVMVEEDQGPQAGT